LCPSLLSKDVLKVTEASMTILFRTELIWNAGRFVWYKELIFKVLIILPFLPYIMIYVAKKAGFSTVKSAINRPSAGLPIGNPADAGTRHFWK
jgi:hypothetical protein